MALILCKKCGNEISDKAIKCPHCGENVCNEEPVENKKLCEECGFPLEKGVEACPKCGCPVENDKVISSGEKGAEKTLQDGLSSIAKKAKNVDVKSKAFIAAIAVIALVAVLAIALVSHNSLSGKDKSAYNCVIKASQQFKDPSSVRLESGTYNGGFLFCGLSAKNGFGARGTGYYTVGLIEGIISEEENPDDIFMSKTNLNIDKINKKLSKYFESY